MKHYLIPELHNAWAKQPVFDTVLSLHGQVYRALENRRTLSFSVNNQDYFAKIHLGVGVKEIVKNIFQGRLPILGAKNEWLAILRLQALGINTMEIAGFGQRGVNPARLHSFLITKALNNMQSLEDFCRDWTTTPPPLKLKRQLLRQVAHIARTLHCNGLNHRDFYLCHFLKDAADTLFLIDLHRAQIRRKTPTRWIIKDLSGLYFSALDVGLTKWDLLRFIKYYTKQPLKKVLSDVKFWRAIHLRATKLHYKTYCQQQSESYVYQQQFSEHFICDQRVDKDLLKHSLKTLDEIPPHHALKLGDTTTVGIIEMGEKKYVVKRYNLISFWHRLRRSLRHTRAHHAWQSAMLLAYHQLKSPRPIAMLEHRFGILRGKSYYVTEYIEGISATQFFTQETDPQVLKKVGGEVVQVLKKLISANISHGDLKATNIIIHKNTPYLIDLDAMQQHSNPRKSNVAIQKDYQRFMKNWLQTPAILQMFRRLLG